MARPTNTFWITRRARGRRITASASTICWWPRVDRLRALKSTRPPARSNQRPRADRRVRLVDADCGLGASIYDRRIAAKTHIVAWHWPVALAHGSTARCGGQLHIRFHRGRLCLHRRRDHALRRWARPTRSTGSFGRAGGFGALTSAGASTGAAQPAQPSGKARRAHASLPFLLLALILFSAGSRRSKPAVQSTSAQRLTEGLNRSSSVCRRSRIWLHS